MLRRMVPRTLHSFTAPTLVAVILAATSLGGSTSCGPPSANNADGGADTAEPPPPGCAFELPEQEARCPEIGLQCEYGTVDRVVCNSLATCTETGWAVIPPDPRCTPNDEGCPNDALEITRGSACTQFGITCGYATGTCRCEGAPAPGGSDWEFRWSCADAEGTCPKIRPRLGTRCADEGQRCSYGGCNLVIRNVTQSCLDGRWKQVEDDCGDAGTPAGDAAAKD